MRHAADLDHLAHGERHGRGVIGLLRHHRDAAAQTGRGAPVECPHVLAQDPHGSARGVQFSVEARAKASICPRRWRRARLRGLPVGNVSEHAVESGLPIAPNG